MSGLTRKELGERLGMTRQTVRNYETGTSMPKLHALAKWSKICGVSIEWLVFGPPSESHWPAEPTSDTFREPRKPVNRQSEVLTNQNGAMSQNSPSELPTAHARARNLDMSHDPGEQDDSEQVMLMARLAEVHAEIQATISTLSHLLQEREQLLRRQKEP
ncbi:MAG: helix-turn-helix transcriptional regulator [Acidimicrobiaceae bacterium]|nr:helix-turn-helix transcriptional regulator [Acidimicrobiaceae bacterium]